MSDDPNLSQRYRELPREEPPRALDDAILAASRHAVSRRRWYVPLATAAVLTLVVAVTLHIQREPPSEEVDAVSPSMKVQETPPPPEAPKAAAKPSSPRFTPDPRADSGAPVAAAPPAAAPAEAPPVMADERKTAQEPARSRAESAAARVQSAPARQAATTTSVLARIAPSPEQWLQGIADLRRQGRHEEADRELAEFRKRYPDYRLSDEMKAKVERH